MDGNPHANAEDMAGSIPGLGRFHELQNNWACRPQLPTEASVPRAWALQEGPPPREVQEPNAEEPTLAATRESLRTATKTQLNQKKEKKILKYIYLRYIIWWFNICKHCEIFPTIKLTNISIASHSCHFLFVSAWGSWYVFLSHLICAKPCVCAGNRKCCCC